MKHKGLVNRAIAKKILATILKFGIVAILIWWMIRGGRLNASSMAIFFENKRLTEVKKKSERAIRKAEIKLQ